MINKLTLLPGAKVRGYGILNEFGEFNFIPEQTGVRAGQRKVVAETSDFSVAETKNSVCVHINIRKDEPDGIIFKYLRLTTAIIVTLKKYY